MTSHRRIRLSQDAEDDLTDIFQHSIDTWGQERAEAYRSTLHQALHELATFPGLGRARDEFGPGTRSHIVIQHVIVYRSTNAELFVSRIVHVRRDLERVMRG
ncbi:MAG: type II toxin-antitoxin system RelE/ParE family toxin [Thermomicrobiales bacterium]